MRRTAVAILLLLTTATMAKADSITFKLDEANIAVPGPYADVTVNLINPTTALVLFESLGAAGNLYLFGGQGAVALNVDATSFTVTDFTGGNDGAGFLNVLSDLSQGAAGNQDGFGSFNLTVDSFDGYSHSWDNIGFTLTNTGGTWTNALDVLVGNNDLQVAAAHIFVCQAVPTACSRDNEALITGFASGFDSGPGGPPPPPPPPEPVPEPTTLVMLGSGLVAVASRLRRKRS